MKIKVDTKSRTPLYLQVIFGIEDAIRTGALKTGEAIPSMNELSQATDISMETVKKAYNILKDKGLLEATQGKGYFVASKDPDAPKRILLLFDKMSSFKLDLYRSFVENLNVKSDITIHLHNQDIEFFEALVGASADKYDYYLVTPNFKRGTSPQRIRKAIGKIPNKKLILLDKEVPGLTGNIGSVTQDFENDPYDGLKSAAASLRKYKDVKVLCSASALFADIILKGVTRFFDEQGIAFRTYHEFTPGMVTPGTAFLVLGGQIDTEHLGILREVRDRGLELGTDVGLLVYNNSPLYEFISGGLSCLSTDFIAMGRHAAEMINSGRPYKMHNEFDFVKRNSL